MVANGGRINAQPRRSTLQGQLTLTVEHVADELPVHQVLGVIDGHAREILERGIDQIEVIAYTTNRRIGVIAWNDGITQCLCL